MDELKKLMSVVRHAASLGKLEAKRIQRAKILFVTLSCLIAVLLGVDYTAARIIFSYLDPTLGSISLGPDLIALCVPIAVIAVHLLISDDGGKRIEYRLRRLAGVGVFVFLFGIAMMFVAGLSRFSRWRWFIPRCGY